MPEAPDAPEAAETGSDGRNLPVLAAEARAIPPSEQRSLERVTAVVPAPALAAAGGFVVGVAAYVFVRLMRAARRPAGFVVGRSSRRLRRRKERALEVAGSRSFLVDVHFLKR